ncbi:MAG: hypothetical protein IT452_16425 [Planctomycetia bacterium]|nr:hypothetical protein [Planctomycetia bacterium]
MWSEFSSQVHTRRLVTVSAGVGGAGCIRRCRNGNCPTQADDAGGPGGHGANLRVIASTGVRTLEDVKSDGFVGEAGRSGGPMRFAGENAPDLLIRVPVGTVVIGGGPSITRLKCPGHSVIVARGGAGGLGGHQAASLHEDPTYGFSPGTPGETRRILLVLKPKGGGRGHRRRRDAARPPAVSAFKGRFIATGHKSILRIRFRPRNRPRREWRRRLF